MRRRAVLALPLGVPGLRALGATALPQRNLRIELRWVRDETAQHRAAAGEAGVVVGTGGRADTRGSVVLRAGENAGTEQGLQQVLVLNGGQAALHLGQLQPLQWVELAMTPRGPVAVLRQAVVETGSQITVRPRWPGTGRPVAVEVAQTMSDADGRAALLTTLELPLDEWVTVAQHADAATARERDVLRSRDARRERRRLLQMRVSLP